MLEERAGVALLRTRGLSPTPVRRSPSVGPPVFGAGLALAMLALAACAGGGAVDMSHHSLEPRGSVGRSQRRAPPEAGPESASRVVSTPRPSDRSAVGSAVAPVSASPDMHGTRPSSAPLLAAVAAGDCRAVGAMLDAHPELVSAIDQGVTALHAAAFAGHTDVVHLLIERRADPNARDARKQSPLHFAASSGHAAAVQRLLAAGADPDVQDERGQFPYDLAARGEHRGVIDALCAFVTRRAPELDRVAAAIAADDLDSVRVALLAQPGLATARGPYGRTLLHVAAHHLRPEIASLLVTTGADPNVKAWGARSPLCAVVESIRGRSDATRGEFTPTYSVEPGASLSDLGFGAYLVKDAMLRTVGGNARNDGVRAIRALDCVARLTPEELHRACALVECLGARGAESPSFTVARALLFAPREVVAVLLDCGLDPTAQLPFQRGAIWSMVGGLEPEPEAWATPLQIAAMFHREDVVSDVLARLPPEPRARAARDCLGIAIVTCSAELVERLFTEAGDGRGDRAALLMGAARSGNATACARLLALGCPLHEVSPAGQSALHLAAFDGDVSTIETLVRAGASLECRDIDGFSALLSAAQFGHFDAVRTLLDAGARLEARAKDRRTALHMAAAGGRTFDTPTQVKGHWFRQTVRLLIDRKADVGACDDEGYTPLHYAAIHDDVEVIGLLLDAGAQVGVGTQAGETPLHSAAIGGMPTIASRLLCAGADVAAVDATGRAPLHCATDPSVVQLLVRAKASVDLRDRDGRTPLWHAAERGDLPVVEALLASGADPSIEDARGMTPAWAAQRAGHYTVVLVIERHRTAPR